MIKKFSPIAILITIFVLLGSNYFFNPILANSELPILTVNNSKIFSGKEEFFMQAIAFNHFMEYPYNNNFHQTLPEILSWLHTEEDYARVKSWGLNTVRLYISPSHIDDPAAFEDLKKQVSWAKKNNLYIIITYFSPPGASGANGYYDEGDFWKDIRNNDDSLNFQSPYLKKYLEHWKKISAEFKNESNVIYELLNEPQLLTEWADFNYDYKQVVSPHPLTKDEKIYTNLMTAVVESLRKNQDYHAVIVNSLNYSNVHPRYFRFIEELKKIDKNIIYSFHYYEPSDFIWQQCNWPTHSCAIFGSSSKRLAKQDPGWKNIDINFSTKDFYRNEVNPELFLASSGQPGTYQISSIILKNNNNNKTIWQESFKNKHVSAVLNSNCNAEPILELKEGSKTNTHENVRILDDVLSLSNTSNCYNSEIWSGIKTQIPQLEPEVNYQLSITVKGNNLNGYGSLKLFFYQPDNYTEPVWTKRIQRYQGLSQEIIKLQLEDDYSQIINNFSELKTDINTKHQVPLILGEFAIPERNEFKEDSLEYFEFITKELQNQNYSGWALHNYRETYHNHQECGTDSNVWCGDYRTFGLYSGWGKSVLEMESNGLSTDIINGEYYYRPDLIEAIQKECSTPLEKNNKETTKIINFKPYQKFLFFKLIASFDLLRSATKK